MTTAIRHTTIRPAGIAQAARRTIGAFLLIMLRFIVRLFGRVLDSHEVPGWLDGPSERGDFVGADYHLRLAKDNGLVPSERSDTGLLADFSALDSETFNASRVSWRVHEFYEATARRKLSVTPSWRGPVAPFAKFVIWAASHVAGNLELPLSGGGAMRSRVIDFFSSARGRVEQTMWLRQKTDGAVVYAGFYGLEDVPGCDGTCVKTVFPIPRGWITVILRPTHHGEFGLDLRSGGRTFGEPGFYISIFGDQRRVSTLMVPLHESIRVFVDRAHNLVADHQFTFCGMRFLKLAYAID